MNLAKLQLRKVFVSLDKGLNSDKIHNKDYPNSPNLLSAAYYRDLNYRFGLQSNRKVCVLIG